MNKGVKWIAIGILIAILTIFGLGKELGRMETQNKMYEQLLHTTIDL